MTRDASHTGSIFFNQLQDSPIDWFGAMLDRLRTCPVNLVFVANARAFEAGEVDSLIHDLRVELPRLFACESKGVIPILRLAVHREDDVEAACATLVANHRYLSGRIRQILPRLDALRLSVAPSHSDPGLTEALISLAPRLQHHIAVTSAVILPIARLRLKTADLDLLTAEFSAQLGPV